MMETNRLGQRRVFALVWIAAAAISWEACKSSSGNQSQGPQAGANASGSSGGGANPLTAPQTGTGVPVGVAASSGAGGGGPSVGVGGTGSVPGVTSGTGSSTGNVSIGIGAGSGSPTAVPLSSGALPTAIPSGQLTTGAAGSANPCATPAACQPVDYDLVGPFQTSANGDPSFSGIAGQNVDWVLYGVDNLSLNLNKLSSARNVLVIVATLPQGATATPPQISGQLSTTVTINWTPSQVGTGSIVLLLRDFDRCVLVLGVTACGQAAYLPAYDQPTNGYTIPFTISAGAGAESLSSLSDSGTSGADGGSSLSSTPSLGGSPQQSPVGGLLSTFETIIQDVQGLVPASPAPQPSP